MIEDDSYLEIVAFEYHDILEHHENPTMDISQERKHTWVREIIQEGERYGAPEGSTRTRNWIKILIQLCS